MWMGFLVFGAVAAAGYLAWDDGEPPPEHELLASHMGDGRWFPGRSTLPIPWAPWKEGATLRDGAHLLAALYDRPEAPDPIAMAHFLLWRGGPGDWANARHSLETVEPSAVRYNEEALLHLAADEPYEAYEAIEKGLSLEPGRLELSFNRALALEEMALYLQAREAWNEYLARDPEGPWASEARERLASLGHEAAGPSLEALRYQIRDDLLRAESRADLEKLRAVPGMAGYLEVALREGETIFHKEFAFLEGLDEAGWARRRERVAESERIRADVLAGRLRWQDIRTSSRFEDPLLAVRVAHLIAFSAIQGFEGKAAVRLLEELRSVCFRYGCREEAILATSDYGNLLSHLADYQGAKEKFEEALAALPSYLSLRRAEILAKLAGNLSLTEAPEASERLRREALRLAHVWDEHPALKEHRSAATAGTLLAQGNGISARGLHHAAMAHAHEGRLLAREVGSAFRAQAAAASLARATAALGRSGDASRLLREELALARETNLSTQTARLETVLGEILMASGERDEVLAILDRVIETARTGGADRSLAYRLNLRSSVYEEGGNLEGAIADRREAVGLVERMLQQDLSALARVRMLAELGAAHKHLARLLVQTAKGDPWKRLGGKSSRRLDRDECLVAAVDLDGSVGIFLRVGDSNFFWVHTDGAAVLDDAHCPRGTRKVIVLESPVTLAGFLPSRVRKERPDVAVVVTRDPSRPWPSLKFSGKGLAIHSPEPIVADKVVPRLPSARDEAKIVLQTFHGSKEVSGRDATPATVKAAAGDYDLLHFGVHGEARKGVGAASYLLLGGAAGKLQVVDVLALPLKRAPLVVLSSCRGGGSSGDREHDGAGLPWAFLEAGARAVIATQEDLDDDVARVFSETFYFSLSSGGDVSTAFERAVDRVENVWSREVAAAFVMYI